MAAERLCMERVNERRHILELDCRRPATRRRWPAPLAACDPDNRLIAAQLEKSWETALRQVEACQARLEPARDITPSANAADFLGLANDLETAWTSPNVSMRSRQQLLRALVVDIIADVDEAVRDVILTIHWRGGQHSQLRVRKPKSGEHGCRTPDEALAVIRSMAARWPDEHIAASLNRMGMRTGQGKTWTAHRVGSLRRVHGIHAYLSAEKDGEWLTMRDAAAALGVSSHTIRRLIKAGVLPAAQVVPDAPYQIRQATCIRKPSPRPSPGKGGPVAPSLRGRFQCFQTLEIEARMEAPSPRRAVHARRHFWTCTRAHHREQREGRPALEHVLDSLGEVVPRDSLAPCSRM